MHTSGVYQSVFMVRTTAERENGRRRRILSPIFLPLFSVAGRVARGVLQKGIIVEQFNH